MSRKKSNRVFSDSYVYTGRYQVPTTIRHVAYNEDGLDISEISTADPSYAKHFRKGCINWFNITGLTDHDSVNRMLEEFGFDLSLDGRDVLTPNHVVKVDDYSDHVIVVMGSCFLQQHGKIGSEHVCLLAKEGLVLSFTEKNDTLFSYIEKGLEKNLMNIRGQKSGMLLAFLLNAVFGQLIEAALYLEEHLEDLETKLLDTDHREPKVSSREIQEARHANIILRKNTRPLKDEFSKLQRDQAGVIDESMVRVFTELSDQLEYIIQTSESGKEILSSLEDLYMSHNDLRMNAVMKRLTVVSTLFIPITFLVGLWGMNFKFMPEIDWEWGYIVSLLIIIVTAVGTWIFMKKKKWF